MQLQTLSCYFSPYFFSRATQKSDLNTQTVQKRQTKKSRLVFVCKDLLIMYSVLKFDAEYTPKRQYLRTVRKAPNWLWMALDRLAFQCYAYTLSLCSALWYPAVQFVHTLPSYKVHLQHLVHQVNATHPVIIMNYTLRFLCFFRALCFIFHFSVVISKK